MTSPCASAPGWSWPGSRSGGSGTGGPRRSTARCSPRTRSRWPPGRTSTLWSKSSAACAARSLLLAALKGGKPVVTANKALLAENGAERSRRGPEYRGQPTTRPRCGGHHPAAAPAARVAGRGRRAPRARHRQRHHQLILDRIGLLRRGLRRVAGRGAGARLRRGGPDRGCGGVRRGHQGGHPGRLGLHTPVTAADVHREGITEVTPTDILCRRALGRVVKLLAICERCAGSPGKGGALGPVHRR